MSRSHLRLAWVLLSGVLLAALLWPRAAAPRRFSPRSPITNYQLPSLNSIPHASTPIILTPAAFGLTPPLAEIKDLPKDAIELDREEDEARVLLKSNPPLFDLLRAPAAADPVGQTRPGALAMPAPLANFDGNTNLDGLYPPDTNGDIGYDPATGKRYYFQWVNLHYAAWDVTNPLAPTLVITPTAGNGNDLWQATLPASKCANSNSGDPLVLFDEQAHRWLISQFSINAVGGFTPYHQCVAVSQTANPAGSWYVYDYQYQDGTTWFNDYPHFGIWPDPTYNAYFMTVHQFTTSSAWLGQGVAAFERAKLLTGDASAKLIVFDLYSVNNNYGGMLAADLDGPPPPAGTPGLFFEVDDQAFTSALGPDAIRVWEFRANWVTPAASTFGVGGDPNYVLTVANYTTLACVISGSGLCIPQLGTAQKLDALGDRLMHRAAFRDFGGHQSVVLNHTVDAGSGIAGIRWYELRRDPGSGAWNIHQQSTYAPDSTHRWMGSMSMDKDGNLALGYSVSSASMYPAISYVGRLVTDTLSTLTQAEATLYAGTGAQTGTAGRWGDYANLSVDPQDGCTFWFTTEYLANTTTNAWRTRIASFAYPSCLSGVSRGILTGTVTDAITSAPIVGAQISAARVAGVDSYTAYSGIGGGYQLNGLISGTYTLTASANGYNPLTLANLAISDSITLTQNLSLTPLPTTDLALTQTIAPPPVIAGALFSVTLSATNNGPLAISTTVTLRAMWDAPGGGATLSDFASPGWACAPAASALTCTLPALGVGLAPDVVLTLTAPVTSGAFLNSATLAAVISDTNPLNNTAVTTTTLQARVNLSVTHSGPASTLPGGPLVYTIHAANSGPSSLLIAHASSFTSSTPIIITDALPAIPYPSSLAVSGLSSLITLSASLFNFNHTWPNDVDVLLVAPTGHKLLLMSDAGGGSGSATTNVTLTLNDAAPAFLPNAGSLVSGIYKPTNFDTTSDVFPAPAPGAPYLTTLAGLVGLNPSGLWQLYVRDDWEKDSGAINGGWGLNLTGYVSTLLITDTLPAGASLAGYSGAGWNCSAIGAVVTCTAPNFTLGLAPDLIITATAPSAPGVFTNTVSIGSALSGDVNLADDFAVVTTTIGVVRGVALAPVTSTLSGAAGQTLTHTTRLTNTGNLTDTFTLILNGQTFTTTAPSALTLGPNVGADLVVTVTMPFTAMPGQRDSVTLTVTSQADPTQTASVTLTTSVPLLLYYFPMVMISP